MRHEIIRTAATVAAAGATAFTASAPGGVTLFTSQTTFDAATNTAVVVTLEELEWDPALGAWGPCP